MLNVRGHLATASLIVVAIAIFVFDLHAFGVLPLKGGQKIPPACTNIFRVLPNFSQYFEPASGSKYVCGFGSATYGGLEITVHGYLFELAKDIEFKWEPGYAPSTPYTLYLLLNLTFTDVGDNYTGVAPSMYVLVTNGTYYYGNTEELDNATFPDTYPNTSYGYPMTLSPGESVSFWALFYMPFYNGPNGAQKATAQFRCVAFIYWLLENHNPNTDKTSYTYFLIQLANQSTLYK